MCVEYILPFYITANTGLVCTLNYIADSVRFNSADFLSSVGHLHTPLQEPPPSSCVKVQELKVAITNVHSEQVVRGGEEQLG